LILGKIFAAFSGTQHIVFSLNDKPIPPKTALALASILITYGDSYSKYGADGKLEDYWCDGGEKVVIPPAYYDEAKLKLDCEKTILCPYFQRPGPTNVFVGSCVISLLKTNEQYGIFFCDA
jgi:hypothetical protein